MKIRNGYVSNSSSSSFLVSEDLTKKGIACLKLTQAQKEVLNGAYIHNRENQIGINLDKDIYLTEYVFDGDDRKWETVTSVEHMEYEDGQMCGEPYGDIEDYNEYQIDGDRSVYLRKEHDEAEQMKFSKFAKEFEKHFSDMDVIVVYGLNEVTLKFVK